jgi:hypothetical protein
MSVHTEFYKDINFGGAVDTFDSNYRYFWIKFGSSFKNEISSFRANAYGGFNGNVYGMTENNFLGNYASLNMQENSTSWWSNVGGALNDDIESALLINRNKDELVMELKSYIIPDFISGMDEKLSGTQVSREGDPRIYTTFWPGYDSSKNFVSIEQNLHVSIDWWPDYEAQVRYDIYLYLDGAGHINGYVAWVYVWVEGGIFSGKIFNDLQPKLLAGASTITEKIQSKLSLLSFAKFNGLYLLPGPKPSNSFGDMGDTKSNSTLVLIR